MFSKRVILGLVTHNVVGAATYILAAFVNVTAHAQVVIDQFGHAIPLDSIRMPSANEVAARGSSGGIYCSAGIFNIYFRDVDWGLGTGFDDSVQGEARRDVVCRVFSDLSLLLQSADDPYTGLPNTQPFVNIMVLGGYADGALAEARVMNQTIATPDFDGNTLNDYTTSAQRQGVLDGEVWRTINGGHDSWEAFEIAENRCADYAHGMVIVDFADYTFYTGNSLPVIGTDLYSVIAHEAMHLLGFYSWVSPIGTSYWQSFPDPSIYFSRYDLFLNNGSQNLIIDDLACDWTNNTNSINVTNPCGVFFQGPSTATAQPVYSPSDWQQGSSLSHLDDACGGSYLMNWQTQLNSRLIPSQVEAHMLCDIGYHINNAYGDAGSGWDGTYAALTPCGSRLAGVDDIFDDYALRSFYRVQQGGTITISNFLDNDEDETAPGNIPTSYDCLTILQGGGSVTPAATSFNYTPDPSFVGWAILRYRPLNVAQDRSGNLTYIYIEVRPEDICAIETCSIVNGGDFEHGAMSTIENASYMDWRIDCGNTPDLVTYDAGSGTWVSERNFGGWTHYYGNCPGYDTFILPPSHNGASVNEQYMALISTIGSSPAPANSEHVMFELCRPLIPGDTYTLDYWIYGTGTCGHGLGFDAAEQRPCNQAQGAMDLLGGANTCNGSSFVTVDVKPAAVAAPGWNNITYTFTYAGTNAATWLLAYTGNLGGGTPGYGSILLDDVQIHPLITADATITPACNGQADGSIALDVHYYPGNYSILWNTGATTATLSDLAAGTYTVTITDNELGCATFTESYVVGEANCSGPFTLTKWVTPNNPANTYAGAPVMFTIQACNNDAVDQVVDITDEMPAGFVPAFNSPNNPYWPTATVTIPVGQCITTEITGYFTEIGPHTNTVTLEQDPGISLSADATITLLQGCPMLVSGNGGCQPGDPVSLCLGMHTQLTDVESIDYNIIYPDFVEPPAPGSIMGGITSPFPIASATIGTPTGLSWPPGYSAVPVHVAFSTPVSPSPPYTFFCIGFTVGTAGVPVGENAVWTWASTTPSEAGWNRVTVNMTGGSADLWTQAYHILFTGCPGIDPPNAAFTVEAPGCGGEVSVAAGLSDLDAIHIWTWGDERTTPTNGAQSCTYDYFGPITDNQGWPVNIPPAAPGTYTITHTVIVDGVASTSTQEVTIHACCEADLVIPDGKHSSTLPSSVSGTVDIRGQFIIDQDFTFSNAQVTTEPGAEIIVQPGRNFNVFNSTIESCQGVMWKGITANNGSIVQVIDSQLADAESGWTGLNSSILLVMGSEFRGNRVAISVPTITGVDFNSVSIYSANSSFHAEGPLAQPYPGQTTTLGQTGYAALDVNNMTLNFSGNANVIHDLSNGIVAHRSNVSLANCAMHDIQPDAAYAYVGNGAGIYARGDNGFFTLRQQGYGAGGTSSFDGCRWGIYTEYMNVQSTDNKMVDMGTAYRVDRSGYMTVDILDNLLDTKYNGIDLRFNDGAAHILVADNDITFGNLSDQPTKGYSAINVQEGNMANPSSVIQGNSIHYRHGSHNATNGISLLSASDYEVLGNTLLMYDNGVNRMGIITAGCRRHLISCNDVHGSASNYGVYEGQSAIRNNMGDHATLYCNTVDGTTNGIYFSGPCYGTDLSGNNIKRHQWGLHLDNNAIIEAQDFKGNLWYNAPVNGGLGAWYENAFNASNFPFLYSPAIISGGNTQPPSWAPPSWFNSHSGTNYQCGDEQSGYCGHVVQEEACESCTTGLDQKIAADSLENAPYTEETKWVMEGDLYGKLDNDSSLAATDQELADFYVAMQSTAAGQFKLINDDYLALFHLDSTVLNYLVQNKAQLDTLMGQLKLAMAGMEDTSLTTTGRLALYATIGGLQQNISSLTALNSQALALADTSRVLTAEGVKTANAAIATSELIEANEKQVNEIYLGTVAKGIDGFTTEQAATLFGIANQCPLVGGNAVYRARAMYALIDDEQDYDDPALCLQHGLIYRSMQQVGGHAVSVVPNPASERVTLRYGLDADETGTFTLYDALGHPVLSQALPPDLQELEISTTRLSPAAYHYVVHSSRNGLLGNGRLVIIH